MKFKVPKGHAEKNMRLIDRRGFTPEATILDESKEENIKRLDRQAKAAGAMGRLLGSMTEKEKENVHTHRNVANLTRGRSAKYLKEQLEKPGAYIDDNYEVKQARVIKRGTKVESKKKEK